MLLNHGHDHDFPPHAKGTVQMQETSKHYSVQWGSIKGAKRFARPPLAVIIPPIYNSHTDNPTIRPLVQANITLVHASSLRPLPVAATALMFTCGFQSAAPSLGDVILWSIV